MTRHLRPFLAIGLLCCWTLGSAESARAAGVGIEPGGLNHRGLPEQAPPQRGLPQRDGLDIEPNG